MRNAVGLVVALVGLLFAGALPVEAVARPGADAQTTANKAKQRPAKGSISGTVVHGHANKAVVGAFVHVVHPHRRLQKAVAAQAKAKARAAAPKANAAAKRRHGVTTGAGGAFTLNSVKAGAHVVAAHLRYVGSGHVSVTVAQGQTANVTIHLHKHHCHHGAAVVKPANA